MREATHIIAISRSIYEKYAQILGKEKITVILNGIDPSKYFINEHHILKESTVNLLIIGRIHERKGQIDAIQACIMLHNCGYTKLCLSVVGTGETEYVQYLKKLVMDNKADHYISFYGSSEQPYVYYRKTDIVLMCSKAEAFGRVTVEGMMAGALVIGAESAATAEIIQHGETGLMYSKGNVQKLADQIAYAVDNPIEAAKIAKRGQKYALHHLTDQINANNINNLYGELSHKFAGGIREIIVICCHYCFLAQNVVLMRITEER